MMRLASGYYFEVEWCKMQIFFSLFLFTKDMQRTITHTHTQTHRNEANAGLIFYTQTGLTSCCYGNVDTKCCSSLMYNMQKTEIYSVCQVQKFAHAIKKMDV